MNTAIPDTESISYDLSFPWGYELATDLAITHSRELTHSQQAIVSDYRADAAKVQRDCPDAGWQLNRQFYRVDGQAASRDLATSLDTPLESLNILWWIANQATDADVAVLADWNVDRTIMLARRLRNVSDTLGEMIIQRATQLVDYGLLPTHAPEAYELSLARYKRWTALDSFGGGITSQSGYCGPDTMALTNLFDDHTHMSHVGGKLANIAFHEATHGVGFTTGGSMYLDTDQRLKPVEESFAQHCAEASGDGDSPQQPYVVEPMRRVATMGIYTEFRNELARLTDLDDGGVPLGTIGAALMSPPESARRQTARQQIVQRLGTLADTPKPQHLLAA